jgi:protein-S-isoprenylcysteine O-methyltransferase Ste14
MATQADNPGVVMRPPLLYGIAFVVVLALRWFWPMPIVDHTVATWLGLALVVFAVGIAMWGRRTMQAAGTNVDPHRPTTVIVKNGPFRFSRNPLYMALTLIFLGLSLVVNTWWGIVLLFPVLIIMHWGVVLREERYLDQKFGASYQEYRSKVRRYF